LLGVVTALATVPSILVYWVDSQQAASLLLWMFVPAVYFFIGPLLGLLQNVVPPDMRATTCAILLFTANVANLVIAPQLVGLGSDWWVAAGHSTGESLRWALLCLAPTGFWAGYHLWRAGASIRDAEVRARIVAT
jgi:hypothetical protein